MTTEDPTAIVCIPEAIPAHARAAHVRLAQALFADAPIEAVDGTAEGYRLTLHVGALGDVARWMTNERLCCPFLRFRVEVAPGSDALAVTLTGPQGTREFLDQRLLTLGGAAQ